MARARHRRSPPGRIARGTRRAGRSRWVLRAAALSAAWLGCAGCDAGDPDTIPIHRPDVELVELRATVGVDERGLPVTAPIAADGTTAGVLSTSSLRVRFDRFLLPGTAIRQALCLQPFLRAPEEDQSCPGGVFLEPTYDPARLEIVYRLPRGERLVRGARYQVTFWRARKPDDFGVRAFDGAPLAETEIAQFTTADADPPGAEEERPTTDDLYCSADDCLRRCGRALDVEGCRAACPRPVRALLQGCAIGGCHASGTGDLEGIGPAMDLDLSSDEAIRRTFGRAAHQSQSGERAHEAERSPARLGRAMPLVDPGSPGNSYLLYKLFLLREQVPLASQAEIERLGATLAVGLPMPLPPSAPLAPPDVEALSAWIATGAKAECGL